MLRRLIRFLLASALTLFVLIMLIVVFAALTMGPDVKKDTILVLDLSGPLLEQGPRDWKEKLLVGNVLTTRDVISALEKAKKDDRIRGLIVTSLYSYIGPAKAQEIRQSIRDFAKTSKKPVIGFVEDGGTIDYYICSAAPKLYMPPDGDSWFTLIGIRAEVPFFKGTLDKLGVVAQMDHVGEFKSGSETWTRQNMSDEDRKQTDALLEDLFRRISSDIAADRKMHAEDVRRLIHDSPLISQELKAKRLVDDLLYWDEILTSMKKQLQLKEAPLMSVLEYHEPSFRDLMDQKKDRIAILYGTGTINPGKSSQTFGEDLMGAATIASALREIRKESSIKAVVFRVDSPGGSPSASDLIWREVKLTAKEKPVVVSMGDVAASGGYYVAMPATKIFAEPSTITGSIGVYGGKFYLKGLYDKLGITKEIIKKGEHADLFSDYVPFEEEEWKIIRKHMNHTYDVFTRKAAEGRKRTQKQIDEIARGRVWSGDQAVRIGLVDQIGGLKDAINEAKKLAKVSEVSFAIYPTSNGGLTEIVSHSKMRPALAEDFMRLLHWAQIAEREHLLLLMPYRFFIQ